jgi:hypothetical protein
MKNVGRLMEAQPPVAIDPDFAALRGSPRLQKLMR